MAEMMCNKVQKSLTYKKQGPRTPSRESFMTCISSLASFKAENRITGTLGREWPGKLLK